MSITLAGLRRAREAKEIFRCLWHIKGGVESHRSQGGPHVLIVGGLGPTQQSCIKLQQRLDELGFDAWTAEIDWNKRPVRESVSILDREIRKRFPGKNTVDIVGHSYGGLEGLAICRYSKYRARIGKVVAMGTPFGGTPCREISFIFKNLTGQDPETLERLYTEELAPFSSKVINLTSPEDVIAPPSHGNLKGGAIKVVDLSKKLPRRPITHVSMLVEEEVAGVVALYLSGS